MYPYKFSFFDNKNLNKIISEIENELNEENEITIEKQEEFQNPLVLFEDKGLFFALKENAYLFSKISVNQ